MSSDPLLSKEQLQHLHAHARARAVAAQTALLKAQQAARFAQAELCSYATLLDTYYGERVEAFIDIDKLSKENPT